jgi:transcriptional regulator CtsR
MRMPKKFRCKGLKVEMWLTSFRVEGMATAMQVEYNIKRETVEQLIAAVYDSVKEKAKKDAIRELQDKAVKMIGGLGG